MKMDYRRDLQHNYLVVETGEKTENYITRMMTENQVQGLLGCECRRMDQKKLYYYDITSKISLAEKSRLKKVKGSEVLLIIQGLLQVLVQLEEYLIPADQICLDWNYIYLDPVSCYPSFCCLPAAEKKLEQGIRELLEELLPRLDHQEQTGVSVVYELYQYAIQDTFSVMGLQSVLERRLMEERKTTETELQACQEKKSREHQETSYFGDNRQAVLEDFFSSEEEEGENGRVSPVLVGMVLGIIGVFVVCTGRVCCSGICSTISGNLGSIGCDGGINCSDLAGGCEKKKKTKNDRLRNNLRSIREHRKKRQGIRKQISENGRRRIKSRKQKKSHGKSGFHGEGIPIPRFFQTEENKAV